MQQALMYARVIHFGIANNITAIFFGRWAASACATDGTPCPIFSAEKPVRDFPSLSEQTDIAATTIVVQPPMFAVALYRDYMRGYVASVQQASTQELDVSTVFSLNNHSCTRHCECIVTVAFVHIGTTACTVAVTVSGAVFNGYQVGVIELAVLACAADAINNASYPNACAVL